MSASKEPAAAQDRPRPHPAWHPARLRARILETRGWTRAGLAFAAGLLSVLAFAPFFLWPVLFLTLPVLVWLIDGPLDDGDLNKPARLDASTLKAAFRDGWWWGFGFFIGGLFWVGEAFLVEADKFAWALPLAVVAMPAGLALFYGAAAAAARTAWSPGVARLLVLAVALAAADWLRGHILTGFPWNVLGYALTSPLTLMQSASVLGIYGLSLWAVMIFTAPLVMAAGDGTAAMDTRRGWRKGLAIAAIPLAVLTLFGVIRLSAGPAPMLDNIKLRIVQPSVPQREKWLPEKQREIFQLHLGLSRRNAAGVVDDLKGVTHVVWPEAAMPFRPLEHREALDAIGELLVGGSYLVSGGLRVVRPEAVAGQPPPQPRAYNSLFFFGPGGGLAALYDKIRLVPFGEFLPLQPWLEAIGLEQLTRQRGGFSTGIVPRPLITVGGLPPAAVLICYEAIFAGSVVQGSERPGVIINVTNDGWFGDTTGPRQHFHQTRVRAVEEGVPIIRAANNGISAMVGPDGSVLSFLGMNVRGVIDSGLPAALPVPVYARLGDRLFVVNALIFSLLSWVARRGTGPSRRLIAAPGHSPKSETQG